MKESNCNKKIFTIPNVLSMIRLILIPFMVWLYHAKKEYVITGILLIVSGVTDVIDGFIARKFNMISDVGKVLDPIADKLTQLAMLFCLLVRYPLMLVLIILMVIKEAFALTTGILRVKKTNSVHSSSWHGKIATVLLYGMFLLHVFWVDIDYNLSAVLIFTCAGLIILSGILYGISNITAILFKSRDNKVQTDISEDTSSTESEGVSDGAVATLDKLNSVDEDEKLG